MEKQYEKFDFDAWMQLAKDDPEAFEAKRRAAVDEAIEGTATNSRKRLEGLQWRVDRIREQTKTPMAACLKISDMMWQEVSGEDGLVDHLNQLCGNTPIKEKSTHRAEVVQLQAGSEHSTKKIG